MNTIRSMIEINNKELIDDFSDYLKIDKNYSKKIFNVGYPVLVENRDPARYYSDPVSVDGKNYYICNDWYDHNKQALIDWIEKYS